jgi:MFS superfamily sulfate permease-like transporter
MSSPPQSSAAPSVRPALRFDRHETAGSLGDLGVFVPLLVGMVNRCGLQFAPALFFAGLMNVVTGLVFRIPMPVQPMKAIAAVAIAEGAGGGLNEAQILAAGILCSAALLLLALSGMIERLDRAIPRPVVRGLQLALGLKLMLAAVGMITATGRWFTWDGIAPALGCAALVLALQASRRFPGALVVFIIGLIGQLIADPTLLQQLRIGPTWTMPDLGDAHDWWMALHRAAIPQLPLTLLNSVIAVCALSVDLFPRSPARPRRVAVSVALMNLLCCPLGAMPMCHGTGGLAAQYRFGARTGGSVVLLGAAKMALALLLGSSLLAWLQAYPRSVLGVLLLFGGIELAKVCRDQRRPAAVAVMLITGAACVLANMTAGFALGWIASLLVTRFDQRSRPNAQTPG